MINIIFCGIGGRIGHTMYTSLLRNSDFKLVCGIDKMANAAHFDIPVYNSFDGFTAKADVIIDFSKPEAVLEMLDYAVKTLTPVVIATTGHNEQQLGAIKSASEIIPVFMASNMSLGVNLLANLAKDAAKFLGNDYDVEIIEQHHNQKVDSPSGTALTLARAVSDVRDLDSEFVYGRHEANKKREKAEIGIHAVRGGAIVGKHDVMFIGSGEIITLSHEAMNKEVFVSGSLRAAAFIVDKPSGLYDMTYILGSLYAVTNVSVEKNITLITIPEISQNGFNELLTRLAVRSVNLDMISETLDAGDNVSVSFTLSDADAVTAYEELYRLNCTYFSKEGTAKITSEGAGMEHRSGVAKEVLKLVAESGARIYSVTTSETKISCAIDCAAAEVAEKKLKEFYKL